MFKNQIRIHGCACKEFAKKVKLGGLVSGVAKNRRESQRIKLNYTTPQLQHFRKELVVVE